jgi:ketosteroid isomerase-like protein
VKTSLADVYKHWGAGDWTPQFDFYAENMEWGWSDEFPGIAGVYVDTATPNPRLQTWLAEWDYWYCQAEEFIVCRDTVVVLTRYRGRGKGSGVEVDSDGAHVWKLRDDGKAIRLEVFADRERALAAAEPMPCS